MKLENERKENPEASFRPITEPVANHVVFLGRLPAGSGNTPQAVRPKVTKTKQLVHFSSFQQQSKHLSRSPCKAMDECYL